MFVFSVYILTSRAVTDAFPKQNRDVDILCTHNYVLFLVRTELEKKKDYESYVSHYCIWFGYGCELTKCLLCFFHYNNLICYFESVFTEYFLSPYFDVKNNNKKSICQRHVRS